MVGRSNPIAMAAVAVPGIAGVTISGCATPTPASLNQKLDEEGAAPDSVSPDMVRPDGTLNNGLLPEAWGDTSQLAQGLKRLRNHASGRSREEPADEITRSQPWWAPVPPGACKHRAANAASRRAEARLRRRVGSSTLPTPNRATLAGSGA